MSKKTHPNSPHLSIKRLRELAKKWRKSSGAGTASWLAVEHYVDFVEESRASLTSNRVKK